MMSNDDLKTIINECELDGITVGVKEIAFVILSKSISDTQVPYRVLFGHESWYDQANAERYAKSEQIRVLSEKISKYLMSSEIKGGDNFADISFEENKAYMLNLKKKTEEAMDRGEIEKKDGLKILADISVKLNDKFAVVDNSVEQVVIVKSKYSGVCEHCGHEVAPPIMSKKEAMARYGLVDPNTSNVKGK